jgi:hypothetical protein
MSNYDNKIEMYNKQLANTFTKVDLIDYITELHNRFYSEYDISFMKYFMELVKHKNEFVVDHEKLIEFGVITTNRSSSIKLMLDQFNFKENENYLLHNVMQQSESSRGAKYVKKYILTPKAFKKCLMRSKNTDKYTDYYTFIEDVMKYYSDYQLELAINEKQLAINEKQLVIKEKELISIDNKELKNENQTLHQKVDGLVNLVETQTQLITSQSRDMQELLGHTKDVKASNHILVSSNEKILTQLSELHS